MASNEASNRPAEAKGGPQADAAAAALILNNLANSGEFVGPIELASPGSKVTEKRAGGGESGPPKKRKKDPPSVALPTPILPKNSLPGPLRDPRTGTVPLPPTPVRVTAGLHILKWGSFENCGPAFYHHGNWFPVGYQSRRKTADAKLGPRNWICEIESKDGHPYFIVFNEDLPEERFGADTSSGVWRQVLGRTCAGPFMYGLSVDSVREHIQRMAEAAGLPYTTDTPSRGRPPATPLVVPPLAQANMPPLSSSPASLPLSASAAGPRLAPRLKTGNRQLEQRIALLETRLAEVQTQLLARIDALETQMRK